MEGSEPHSISDTVEVSFPIACPCGQVLTVGPTMVGLAVRCPRCQTLLEVPAPDDSYLVPEPPTTKPPAGGAWRTTVSPPRPDNFLAEELKRNAAEHPPPEPEKKEPIDPTPLLAVLGGTIVVLLLVGLGFFALDRYIDELKENTRSPTRVESVEQPPADANVGAK